MGFSANPVIAVGDLIRVQNIGTEFDGDVLVISSASNTITYTSPVSNATFNTISTNTAVVTNTTARVQVLNAVTEVRVSPVAATETDFASAAGDTSYNVPGSKVYNADNAIDNIIVANETGTTSGN